MQAGAWAEQGVLGRAPTVEVLARLPLDPAAAARRAHLHAARRPMVTDPGPRLLLTHPIHPQRLLWILRETFEPKHTRTGGSFLEETLAQGKDGLVGQIFEVGPRLTFSTAYSSNAVS